MQYVGRFGNANPHYISDWIKVELDQSKDKFDITVDWDENTGTCAFPSSYFVQVFYTKINTKSKPQYQIVKVSHYADTLNAWVFKKPNAGEKQDFQALLSVQFYEYDQEANFYSPKTPNPFKPLPRNILYPFYVYGGANHLYQGVFVLSVILISMFV